MIFKIKEPENLSFIIFGVALFFFLASLVWYGLTKDPKSTMASTGAVVLAASRLIEAEARKKAKLEADSANTQKAGKEALAGADKSIQEMHEVEGEVAELSTEKLTQEGNRLFGKEP